MFETVCSILSKSYIKILKDINAYTGLKANKSRLNPIKWDLS